MEELDQEVDFEEELEFIESKNQYLIFSVSQEYFGIDIKEVIEIIGMELINIIPEMPPYIKGVINLRGKVIPVMDVRIRFNKPEKEYDGRTCIIVVEINNIYMGLIIDEVIEVMSIQEEEIMNPPKAGKDKESITSKYIWGLVQRGEGVRLLIDGKKLLEK